MKRCRQSRPSPAMINSGLPSPVGSSSATGSRVTSPSRYSPRSRRPDSLRSDPPRVGVAHELLRLRTAHRAGIGSTATNFNPQRERFAIDRIMQIETLVQPLVNVEGVASFMVNWRTRSSPDFGLGSSRNLPEFGTDLRQLLVAAQLFCDSVMISSWVMPRQSSAPLRSLRRNILSPMVAQRPLCSMVFGRSGQIKFWPIWSISSRTMAMILLIERWQETDSCRGRAQLADVAGADEEAMAGTRRPPGPREEWE